MSKENKDTFIKFRLTWSQKHKVEEYAAAADLNVSEFMRLAIEEYLSKH